MKIGSRRRFLKGAAYSALLLAGVRLASAHAKLVRSEPKDAAQLTASPKRIELWFNELLDDEFNTVEVYRAKEVTQKDRKNLVQSKPKVDVKDRTYIVLDLPVLEPDSYTVEYRVLSRDGHTAPGRFNFTVLPKS